jgi:hypothetical protein
MNEMLEFHGSTLAAVSWADGVAVVLLRSVRAYRSEGRAAVDAGEVWLREVMFTMTNASVSAQGRLPVGVRDGSVCIGTTQHHDVIPEEGVYAGDIHLELVLDGTDYLKVTGDQMLVTLTGEPTFLEKFEP